MSFAYGSGTELDPYQIWTASDLDNVRNYLSSHFKLMTNIDLEGGIWVPIGDIWTTSTPFTGTFDGDSHIIEGLSNSLFGVAIQATVINLTGKGDVVSTEYVGGMFQEFTGGFTQNCDFLGTVTATAPWPNYVGGFAGFIGDSWWVSSGVWNWAKCEVKQCHVLGEVIVLEDSRCDGPIGGFVGGIWTGLSTTGDPYYTEGTFVTDCYAKARVDGRTLEYGVGGFVGEAADFTGMDPENIVGEFKNCYAVGEVIGVDKIGGFCGLNYLRSGIPYPMNYINCYYDSEVCGLSDTGKGEPRTTAQMVYPYTDFGTNTYVDWDFSTIWHHDKSKALNGGYPQFEAMSAVRRLIFKVPYMV